MKSSFVRRIAIRNYKSSTFCDTALQWLHRPADLIGLVRTETEVLDQVLGSGENKLPLFNSGKQAVAIVFEMAQKLGEEYVTPPVSRGFKMP